MLSQDIAPAAPTVCETLRLLRRRNRWTQSEVGARLCPPRSHAAVSDIERGRTALTLDLLTQFAVLYAVRVVDLIGDGARTVLPEQCPACHGAGWILR